MGVSAVPEEDLVAEEVASEDEEGVEEAPEVAGEPSIGEAAEEEEAEEEEEEVAEETAVAEPVEERVCSAGDGQVVAIGYDSVDPAVAVELHGEGIESYGVGFWFRWLQRYP